MELTVALHFIFNFKEDKLVWDVGHQAYIHKLLTGRKHSFDSIRKFGGISGFPNIDESPFDHFGTGHSSTSISAVVGMAEAALLDGKDRNHIAVIGDGSLSGGMAFEALNNLGDSNANVLVIVNDNQIGIDPNSGALGDHLNDITKTASNIFTHLNIAYSGPIDGHSTKDLIEALEDLKSNKGPKVLHIKTLKGKGYKPAEEEQTDWHSVSYVKINPAKKETREVKPLKFQDVFGHTLVELAKLDKRVVGITPAMPSGSSMKFLMDELPERVFDVGIAEQHAVTFAAGLALEGKRPFCNIYSSFAQRAFDQIIHDVALQNIPVIFCLDRAGLVGADGPTHHGVFDLAFLNAIPNLVIMSPMDEHELRDAMYFAKDYVEGPIVIRYPRGRGSKRNYHSSIKNVEIAKSRALTKGTSIAIFSIGQIGTEVQKAIAENDLTNAATHIDARFMKPLDLNEIGETFRSFSRIITIEEGCLKGGFGESIKVLAHDSNYKGTITALGLPDNFIEHGEIDELREKYGLDAQSISKIISTLV